MTDRRHIRAFAAVVLGATLLGGCGGGSGRTRTHAAGPTAKVNAEILAAAPSPGGVAQHGTVVARVGSTVIRKSAFDALMEIEAHGQSQAGREPIRPVPPAYASCVTQLAEQAAGFGTASSHQASPSQLKKACAHLYDKYRRNVLTSLISQEWVIHGSAERGVTVTDAEVRKRLIQTRKSTFPSEAEYLQYLAASGETISNQLFATKVDMLSTKLRQKIDASTGPVNSARVVQYYSANLAQYTDPELRDVGFIKTRRASTAAQVKHELESGLSFATVAARHLHEQPPYAKQGLLTGLKPHEFGQKALNDPIFAAPLHKVIGPIRLNLFPGYNPRFHRNPVDVNNIDGYYVFAVETIRPPRPKPFTTIAPRLEKEVPEALHKQALASFIKEWRPRWRSRTDCSPGFVVPKCRQYRAPKTEPPEDPHILA